MAGEGAGNKRIILIRCSGTAGSTSDAQEQPIDLRYGIRRTEVVDLTDEDLQEIHGLRCRAADFFAEVGDDPPSLASLQGDLDDLPDGYSAADEVMYRLYDADGLLQAYAEVLRGFATRDQWIIGILLVDSDSRSRGIGRAAVDAIAVDARQQGALSLAAGVIALRERSLKFWRDNGFTTEARRRPFAVHGVETEVIRLVRELHRHE